MQGFKKPNNGTCFACMIGETCDRFNFLFVIFVEPILDSIYTSLRNPKRFPHYFCCLIILLTFAFPRGHYVRAVRDHSPVKYQ